MILKSHFPEGLIKCVKLQRLYASYNQLDFHGLEIFHLPGKLSIFRSSCEHWKTSAIDRVAFVSQQVGVDSGGWKILKKNK